MHDHAFDISVCIPNYNGMSLIDNCLASVQKQNCGLKIEIIVHDDASSDESVSHIRTHYPQVTLIESSTNVGFCIANNRMVDRARGKYLLLLNNDAELLPDAVQTLYRIAQEIDTPSILGLPQYNMTTGQLIDRGSRLDLFLNPIPNLNPQRTDVNMIIGACLWVPRSLWREIGGFPDWFGSMAEDMFLCCAAKIRGYPVMVLQESGFRHHVGASFGGGKVIDNNKLVTSLKRRRLSERNKSFVMTLTYPAPVFYIVFPLHVLLLLLEGTALSLVKRNSLLLRDIYIHCIRSLWQERAKLRKLRSQIQKTRKIGRLEFFKGFQVLPHKLIMLLRYGLPKIN